MNAGTHAVPALPLASNSGAAATRPYLSDAMHTLAVLAILAGIQVSPQQTALDSLREAVGSGVPARVEALFARKADAAYLLRMAERRGGLRRVRVKVVPSPPGWEREGPFWAVFHTAQNVEADHDVVHALARTPDGFVIGREVPEYRTGGYQVRHTKSDVEILPAASTVRARIDLELAPDDVAKSPVFRLNDRFTVLAAQADGRELRVVTADDRSVPVPQPGEILRAGGLLIPWSETPLKALRVEHEGVVKSDGEDKVSERVCYLTALWVPTVASQPHTSSVRVTAPSGWTVVSEGVEAADSEVGFEPREPQADKTSKTFHCVVPISFPKVVGGRYVLAAEAKDEKGRLFRSYQLEPVEKDRAERDVRRMRQAVAFFEEKLGPFPFPGYSCFDADTYYGIESYSYTLLNRAVTTRFVSHEIAHTYFGGLVPCSYTRDTWNEGVAQYVDSVLFDENRDRTLQNALRSLDLNVPLSEMSVPHEYGSATYWRGAYVMRMLESEFGLDAVLRALRAVIEDRRGVDTSWAELRPYFEKAGGQNLEWFWSQWIDGASFPKLEIVEARRISREKEWTTWVTVRQSGTSRPFRVRFALSVADRERTVTGRFALSDRQGTLRLDSSFVPRTASLDVFGHCLATSGPDVGVRP